MPGILAPGPPGSISPQVDAAYFVGCAELEPNCRHGLRAGCLRKSLAAGNGSLRAPNAAPSDDATNSDDDPDR